MDWTKVRLYDGWKVDRDENALTLSASFYAERRDYLPEYGDTVCGDASNINCVPEGFETYKIASVSVNALTPVGPYTAEVIAKPWIKSLTQAGKSLTTQTSFTMDIIMETCLEEWTKSSPWDFVYPAKRSMVNVAVPFMLVTTTHYVKKKSSLGSWGTFYGVIPSSSFPSWLSVLPSGATRWRLEKEQLEQTMDTNGRTVIYKVTRQLKGITDGFEDYAGDRMKWHTGHLGTRSWADI